MRKFNYAKRQQLEKYLRKGVTVARVSKGMDISRSTVYKEMKLGMSEKDFINREYEKYSADKAQESIEQYVMEKVR